MARIFDRILQDGSSSDESDEDYVPPEQVEVEGEDSESGEADLEPSSGGDTDVDYDRRKRKRKVRVRERSKKKRKSDDSCNDETTSNEAVTCLPIRSYSNLGTGSGTSSGGTGNTSTPSPGNYIAAESTLLVCDVAPASSSKQPLAEVFTDKVAEPTKTVIIPVKSKPAATHATALGALLSTKKKKSTFDNVKAGWQQHVEETGIAEELALHNKGKGGFLNRKEFLEQANYREYELSLNAKTGSSSKRSST